jgi:hypothetical protein
MAYNDMYTIYIKRIVFNNLYVVDYSYISTEDEHNTAC